LENITPVEPTANTLLNQQKHHRIGLLLMEKHQTMSTLSKDVQDSIYETAIKQYEEGNFAQAFPLFRQLAEAGNPDGCSMLAIMYDDGHGVEADFETAILWDLKAIGHGSMISLSNLAITYRRHGNCREARKWFEKAVESGDGDAMLDLARLLDVSDHETSNVERLLRDAISSNHITEAGREEAAALLNEMQNRAKSI
jgi:uncharacterized protein